MSASRLGGVSSDDMTKGVAPSGATPFVMRSFWTCRGEARQATVSPRFTVGRGKRRRRICIERVTA